MTSKVNGPYIPALSLFGLAFACCEAATVTYIRLMGVMPAGLDYREIWSTRGLRLSGNTVVSELSRLQLLPAEYVREVATLLILAAAGTLAGRNLRERMAAFVFCFTVWDLSYYGWLRLFCGFPRSLFQTDIYFLLPIPSYGPVWFPLVGMAAGLVWSMRALHRSEAEETTP
jgi:hypothetical protein